MAKTCPKCSAINHNHEYTCEKCGSELAGGGTLLSSLAFWEEGKNKYSVWSAGIYAVSVVVTLLTHSLIPLGVGLVAAGFAYIKGHA